MKIMQVKWIRIQRLTPSRTQKSSAAELMVLCCTSWACRHVVDDKECCVWKIWWLKERMVV